MKKVFLFLVFAALLTSCNINIDVQGNNQKESDPTAVGFGVYMKRGVTTKAGYAGELTTDTLKKATVGFGVFSYYGNGAMYNETMKPDFMYNQWVKFTSNNVWEYSPIKYWPNEFGEAAGNEIADRLTFFAYAPYVAVTPSTGIVTDANDEDGILGMTRNISAGDPQVMYGARLQPGGGVDLCWGVAASDFTSSVDGNNNKIDKGKPFINLIKPKTGDKISFEFNHALAQLNVQIDADIDVESHATSTLDPLTRIYVRSVTFTGFALRGSLNLNSEAGKPVWSDISGTGRLRRDPVTIYDGRSDGLEGVASAVDVTETPAYLSPVIIQSKKFGQETTTESRGVTNETVNLFANCDTTSDHSKPVAEPDAPVMVIPIAGVPLTVTIVYDIETKDPNLAGYLSDGETRGISVENKITKSIQLNDGNNMTLEAGKKYIIGLHLGLTSVKFDAQVADWDNNTYEGTAYLPVNTSLWYYIHDEDSWNAAYNALNSPLKAYYDANPDEDRWVDDPDNPGHAHYGTSADKVNGQWPSYAIQCWKGAINANGAKYPWAVVSLPIPFTGQIEMSYDGGTPIYPWTDEQLTNRTSGYGVASIPVEFGRDDWLINPETGRARADGTSAAFDPSKLVVKLITQ
jgi:hypothetical protein